MGLHSSDEILFLPNEDLVSQFSHTKYLVDHDNILILSPNNTWLPSFVILEYYLINYVKFSAIYVLTTSSLVSDNRVLVRKIGRRVAGA